MTRWIQAWTHNGDSNLVHAIPDDPKQRALVSIGRMGIYAVRACERGPFRHSRFMRLFSDIEDHATYTPEGWLLRANPAGHDWTADLGSYWRRRCVRCERRLRQEKTDA